MRVCVDWGVGAWGYIVLRCVCKHAELSKLAAVNHGRQQTYRQAHSLAHAGTQTDEHRSTHTHVRRDWQAGTQTEQTDNASYSLLFSPLKRRLKYTSSAFEKHLVF